jgi:hypothetical protein
MSAKDFFERIHRPMQWAVPPPPKGMRQLPETPRTVREIIELEHPQSDAPKLDK